MSAGESPKPASSYGWRIFARHRRSARRGQSVVEFAVVALVVYLLLAAILTFGHAIFVAQGVQQAADLAAREIARTPLPARDDFQFENALADDDVRMRIFDEAYLVIDLDVFEQQNPNGNFFRDAVPIMPLLNQQLATLMIVDRSGGRRLLRYPGALLDRDSAISPPAEGAYPTWVATGFSVSVPIIVGRNGDGGEIVAALPVVEEIEPTDVSSDRHNPFLLTNPVTRGVVALRINYPFQSATMSSFRPNPDGPFESTMGRPQGAVDGEIGELYSGENGLGAQAAFGTQVRPFRRVISGQAIYRREVFQ